MGLAIGGKKVGGMARGSSKFGGAAFGDDKILAAGTAIQELLTFSFTSAPLSTLFGFFTSTNGALATGRTTPNPIVFAGNIGDGNNGVQVRSVLFSADSSSISFREFSATNAGSGLVEATNEYYDDLFLDLGINGYREISLAGLTWEPFIRASRGFYRNGTGIVIISNAMFLRSGITYNCRIIRQ